MSHRNQIIVRSLFNFDIEIDRNEQRQRQREKLRKRLRQPECESGEERERESHIIRRLKSERDEKCVIIWNRLYADKCMHAYMANDYSHSSTFVSLTPNLNLVKMPLALRQKRSSLSLSLSFPLAVCVMCNKYNNKRMCVRRNEKRCQPYARALKPITITEWTQSKCECSHNNAIRHRIERITTNKQNTSPDWSFDAILRLIYLFIYLSVIVWARVFVRAHVYRTEYRRII